MGIDIIPNGSGSFDGSIKRTYAEAPGIIREKVIQILSNGEVDNLPVSSPMSDILSNGAFSNVSLVSNILSVVYDVKIEAYDTDKFIAVYAGISPNTSDFAHVGSLTFQVLADGSIVFMDYTVLSSSTTTSGLITGVDSISICKISTNKVLVIHPVVISTSSGQLNALVINMDANGGMTKKTAVAVNSGLGASSPAYTDVAWDAASSTALVIYSSTSGSTHTNALTISNDVITVGALVDVSASHPVSTTVCVLNTAKFLVSYIISTTVYYAVLTTSGTVVTVAAAPISYSTIFSSTYAYVSSVRVANDTSMLSFCDSVSPGYTVSYYVTFSGNTATFSPKSSTLGNTNNYKTDMVLLSGGSYVAIAGYGAVSNATAAQSMISNYNVGPIFNTSSRCIRELSNNRVLISSLGSVAIYSTDSNATTNDPIPFGTIKRKYDHSTETDTSPLYPVKLSETKTLFIYADTWLPGIYGVMGTYDPSTGDLSLGSVPRILVNGYSTNQFRAIKYSDNQILIVMPGNGSNLTVSLITLSTDLSGAISTAWSRSTVDGGQYAGRVFTPSGIARLKDSDKFIVSADDGTGWNEALILSVTDTSCGIINSINLVGYPGFGATAARSNNSLEYLRFKNGEHVVAFTSSYTTTTPIYYWGYIRINGDTFAMSMASLSSSNINPKHMIALDEYNVVFAGNVTNTTGAQIFMFTIPESFTLSVSGITSLSSWTTEGMGLGEFLKLGDTLYNFYPSTTANGQGKVHTITIRNDTNTKTSSDIFVGNKYNFSSGIGNVTGVRAFVLSGRPFLCWNTSTAPYLRAITAIDAPGMTIGIQESGGLTVLSGIAKFSGGLAAGLDYYYDQEGNLSYEGGEGKKPIGTAISPTELLITTKFPNRN